MLAQTSWLVTWSLYEMCSFFVWVKYLSGIFSILHLCSGYEPGVDLHAEYCDSVSDLGEFEWFLYVKFISLVIPLTTIFLTVIFSPLLDSCMCTRIKSRRPCRRYISVGPSLQACLLGLASMTLTWQNTHTHTQRNTHAHTEEHTHAHTYTRTHTYTHTHTHTHTHTFYFPSWIHCRLQE